MLLEPVGDGIGILAMALNAQGQGFKPLIDQKGPERRLAGTHIPHDLRTRLDNIGSLAEGLRIDGSVVGVVGLGEFRELAVRPVEGAAVHNHAAHLQGVPVHVFGGRMAPRCPPQIQWGGHRTGVANVLSTISGTPFLWVMRANFSMSSTSMLGLAMVSPNSALVLGRNAA